ncbi:MAG: hypothetical protein ACI3ZD_11525 [Prevotella sp.]
MKKFFGIMCLMMMALVTMVCCDQKSTNGKVPVPPDSCITEIETPGNGYNFEEVVKVDNEFVLTKYESSVFFEVDAVLDGYIDEATELNVQEIKTIFQDYKKKPSVIIVLREGAYGENPAISTLNTLWMDCLPIKLPLTLTLQQAIDKVKEANIKLPHSNIVVLKNPFRPEADSPLYIFGQNSTGYVSVNAVTGEVSVIK